MKKTLIIILTALILSVGMIFSTGIYAAETDLSEESYVLNPSTDTFRVNGNLPDVENYYSTGYISLTMGGGNVISISLLDTLDKLQYYGSNVNNISSMYLLVSLGTYYTSAEDGYWNYSDSHMSTISHDELKYSLDPDSINYNPSFTFWWAKPGTSGGAPYTDTGGLRLYSITLVVEFESPISSVINVGTNYAALPDGVNRFVRISAFSLYDFTTNSYHFQFEKNNPEFGSMDTYQFDVSIPESINMSQITKEDGSINIAFTTLDDGSRILYIQPNLDLLPIPMGSGTSEDPLELIAGFVAMNLTTMEYDQVNKLQLDTITNKEANENAYLYAFYDPRVEDILSISFTFQYRKQQLFGLWYTDWESETRVYTKDMQSEVNPPLWISIVSLPFFLAIDGLNVYNVDSIEPITKGDIPDSVLADYINKLGGSWNELDNLNLYKILIGNFDGFIETGYDIQNVVVLNIMYVYQGVVYEAATESIDQTNITPALTSGIDWDGILSWLGDNWKYIVIGVAGLIALIFMAKAMTAIVAILKAVGQGIWLLLKGLGYLVYFIAMGVFYVLKFIFYLAPKGLITFVYVLFTPASKRRENKRKEQFTYVSRSL